MNIKQRTQRLKSFMKDNAIDVALISNFENQFYFSGLKAILYSRPILLVIEKDQESLIIPALEEEHAKEKTNADHLYIYNEVENRTGGRSYLEQVDTVLSKLEKGSTVGIEYNALPTDITLKLMESGFDIRNIQDEVATMRAVKSDEEIEAMRHSGRLVSNALEKTITNTKIGMSELEIDYYGNEYLFKEVPKHFPNSTLDYFVMSPSGVERTNMPHVFSNTRQLENKDIIIHSRQVGLNGYRAECERTYFVGEPTPRQRETFEVMVQAQQAALNFIKVGVTAREVNQQALDVIKKAGLEEYVVHRTGHGIGVGFHEEPSLRFDNDLVLEPGMVFCIEPGIYIPGVGGFRHSDTVVLTESGTEVITDYPRDLDSLVIK
ncbi:aminopeptidase P family protein [Salinicoccus sp. ID82-1]|uniref:Aminopeptidase P family protein n=1 Tax=Salinicoccus cyprini TaxID=2493691 RepID=A0A558AXJ4_9STAP|nr:MULTISPECIES: Xaa-Pro peptidase family protein [Salinicoccus]MCG1008495.1 aminopeptidase P family protein [Salinicoccus sp. ID82-1]TVT28979.1 aminopeptidase P family protein [Salinicoccus cyprini]